jgi:hypothetical protein
MMVDGHRQSPTRRAAPWLLGALVVLWWLRVGLMRGTEVDPYINADALLYWIPLLREAAAQWRAGAPPLWNPYQGLGAPLLAVQQVGAAYPLNALYLVLDVGRAWWLTGLMHHLIAAVGMFGFCRVLELSRPAALVGAVMYAFTALFIGRYTHQPELICLAWLPVLFACAEWLVSEPSFVAVVRLAVVLALQIVGSYPGIFIHSVLLLGGYLGMRIIDRMRSSPRAALHAAAAAAAAGTLALAMTAFQWLPTLELMQRSVRAAGALTPAQQDVLPALPWQFSTGAPGRVPLVLALIGLWTWRRRAVAWFFGSAALMLALLSLGSATPLADFIRRLPTGTWLRAPVRFLNVWPLCIAVLGAAGAQALVCDVSADRRRGRARVVIAAAVIVLVVKVGFARPGEFLRVGIVLIAFDLLPLLAAGGAEQLLPYRFDAGAKRRRRWLLVCFVCAAPGFYLRPYVSPLQVPELYGEHKELFARLREAPAGRALSLLSFDDIDTWAKLGTYFEIPVLNDVEPFSLRSFRTFAYALRGESADTASFEATWEPFMGRVTPPRQRYDGRLLNLAGIRFVLVGPHTPHLPSWFGADVVLVPWARFQTATIYENQAALPRAFFVPVEYVEGGGADCLGSLRDGRFDPSQRLLLDGFPRRVHTENPRPLSDVRIVSYRPGAVRLEVASDRPGFVVLTDIFYPGWVALVDGADTPILRADCFFRAVAVAAGTHEIVLQYRPAPFRIGSAVSFLTAVGIGLCAFFRRRAATRA